MSTLMGKPGNITQALFPLEQLFIKETGVATTHPAEVIPSRRIPAG
ncbi:MAG: hypothetical protein LUQ54_03440 [Methanoregula sp.]|nr:hypothetical protein [Methanoregula sp.]